MEEINRIKKTLKRRVRTLKKSLKKKEEQYVACQQWQKLHHRAELIQSQIYRLKKGDKECVVEDWGEENTLVTIPLDPQLKPFEEVAKLFKRAGKLKKGLPHAASEKKRTEEALIKACALWEQLQAVQTEEELLALGSLPKPQEKKEKQEKTPPKPYIEYISDSGIPIWVGKNSIKNDALTFQYAHGNDLWLHVADYPGSHVVIHPKRDQVIDEATLDKAKQLALYHSKARQSKEGEVILTQVKHVRRLGREKGKVQVAHEKRAYVKFTHPP